MDGGGGGGSLLSVFCVLFCAVVPSCGKLLFVTENDTEHCSVPLYSLLCDFKHASQDVFMLPEDSRFETIFIMNAQRLFLNPALCSSLSLYNITSATYSSSRWIQKPPQWCGVHNSILHLYNVTIDHVPPNLNIFNAEKSHISGSILLHPLRTRMKVVDSYVQDLNLDIPLKSKAEIRIHKTNISSITNMTLTANSQFFLTDSAVKNVPSGAITLRDGSEANAVRSTFLQERSVEINVQQGASVVLEDVKGRVKVISHPSETSVFFSEGEGKDCYYKDSFIAMSILLSFLIFASLLYILYDHYKSSCMNIIKADRCEETELRNNNI